MRALPFTHAFLGTMSAANYAAGTLGGVLPAGALRDWGVSHRDILVGETFRIATGTFLSHDAGTFAQQIVFAAGVIGWHEWTQGSPRTAATFFPIDVAGTLVALFAVLPLLHDPGDRMLAIHDVGMSAGGFGLRGAMLARTRHRGWTLGAVAAGLVVKAWVDLDPIADTVHPVCLAPGAATALLGTRRPGERHAS